MSSINTSKEKKSLGELGPGRLLTKAAQFTLAPLGCTQIGKSRLWIADQRFWAIIIEFQPSAFGKGSYLQVGAMWHWHAKDSWSYDYGVDSKEWEPYNDDHQFAPLAQQLASIAAERVGRLRHQLSSIREIARLTAPRNGACDWPLYHAAVAAGLAGDADGSARLFERLIAEPMATDWQVKLRSECLRLAGLLPDNSQFRRGILAIVQESRALHKLQPDPGCFDGE